MAVYRGWMLTVEQYRGLYDALAARGTRLVNTPEEYRHCHWLPESFDVIRDRSPATVWVPVEGGAIDDDAIVDAARVFGDRSVIVKDYVKSRKHEWNEACFVRRANDRDELLRVVRTFVERQGSLLTGGVVVRELVELESVGTHPRTGMPLTREHRVFVLDGVPLVAARYWAEGDYSGEDVPLDDFAEVMRAVRSRFFTIDLARGVDGTWWIIELGDGQVAGLLDTVPADVLYERLAARLG